MFPMYWVELFRPLQNRKRLAGIENHPVFAGPEERVDRIGIEFKRAAQLQLRGAPQHV